MPAYNLVESPGWDYNTAVTHAASFAAREVWGAVTKPVLFVPLKDPHLLMARQCFLAALPRGRLELTLSDFPASLVEFGYFS